MILGAILLAPMAVAVKYVLTVVILIKIKNVNQLVIGVILGIIAQDNVWPVIKAILHQLMVFVQAQSVVQLTLPMTIALLMDILMLLINGTIQRLMDVRKYAKFVTVDIILTVTTSVRNYLIIVQRLINMEIVLNVLMVIILKGMSVLLILLWIIAKHMDMLMLMASGIHHGL
jgi:hypothetical protein